MYARIEGCIEEEYCEKADGMMEFDVPIDLDTAYNEEVLVNFTTRGTLRVFASGISIEFPMNKVRFINENVQ